MSLINDTIPNLINGVSQQPSVLRLSSQCELQVNAFPSVVRGLEKRPPLRFVHGITNPPVGDFKYHFIDRDPTERYNVIVENNSIRVFDLAGNEQTVNAPNGYAYLSGATPSQDIRLMTVADFTYVLNRKVTCRRDTSYTPTPRESEGLVWVRQAGFKTEYRLNANGTEVAHTTGDGTTGFAADTQDIANNLAQALISNGTPNLQVSRVGSLIYLRRTDGAPFAMEVKDSAGDNHLVRIKDVVQRFTDLPKKGWPNLSVQVRGDSESLWEGYWVRFDQADNSQTSGVWEETWKPGELNRLAANTLPHVLRREADGTFTFDQLSWDERDVGEEETIEWPSFVDTEINDIFFHRNRLGFLCDESVVMSRAGDFYNFWPNTARQTVDTDPIDVAVSHNDVAILEHAVPWNETVVFFSERVQFSLGEAQTLTPDTISINQSTEYEASARSRPVGVGSNIYFASNDGPYSILREYYVDNESLRNDANNVTAHVPKYVPADVYDLVAPKNSDAIFCRSDQFPGRLYLYRFYWDDTEKLQSSWSYWDFGEIEIKGMSTYDNNLVLMVAFDSGLYQIRIELNPDDPYDYTPLLDYLLEESAVSFSYDVDADITTVTLPIVLPADRDPVLFCKGGDGFRLFGEELTLKQRTGLYTFEFIGRANLFWLGLTYTLRYRLSTIYPKQETQRGETPVTEGQLKLRRLGINHGPSGYFRVEVTPLGRPTYTAVYSGKIIGDDSSRVGLNNFRSGTFRCAANGSNEDLTIEILNDRPQPCQLLSIDWTGFYTSKSRG